MLVTDERLGRAVRGERRPVSAPAFDPVASVVVDELAAASGPHAAALRRAGGTFLEAVGATRRHGVTLGLRTAIAGLAATERMGDVDAELRRLTAGDPLLAMLAEALVRHRPDGSGLRPRAEAMAVAGMLSKLIYMFRAQSEAAVLTEVVG